MVSVLDFYSVNTSSDTAEVYFYFTIISKPPSFEAQSFALMQFWLKQPLHVTLQAEEIFIDPIVHP